MFDFARDGVVVDDAMDVVSILKDSLASSMDERGVVAVEEERVNVILKFE